MAVAEWLERFPSEFSARATRVNLGFLVLVLPCSTRSGDLRWVGVLAAGFCGALVVGGAKIVAVTICF